MQAVIVRAPGALSVEDVPDPTPSKGQAVLRVTACGICGTDLRLHQSGSLPPGTIMGHEFCGEVVQAAGHLKVGQRVTALPILSCGRCDRCRSGLGAYCTDQRAIGLGDRPGAYAEYVAVAAHETVRLPDGVDDDHGALVEPLAVAIHAVNIGRIRRGESCLVIGAGPIGLGIALWARHFGAHDVIVAERCAGRRALAEQMGATHVINPDSGELPAALERIAPGGPDVVFEAVGVPGLIQEAIEHVRFRGRLVVTGMCVAPDQLQPTVALAKETSIFFAFSYEKDDFQYTVDMIDQERIAPAAMITGRVGLEGVAGAFEALGKPDQQCKVLAQPGH
ncbi:MAG: alcohol dehydrogenase catalytic domain-containing protein [bacterium]|nr:alcohol dehydrogenase catalytic domain-containing protein [bacterium]